MGEEGLWGREGPDVSYTRVGGSVWSGTGGRSSRTSWYTYRQTHDLWNGVRKHTHVHTHVWSCTNDCVNYDTEWGIWREDERERE